MPFTSDRRLYLTADDEVVEDGDERAATLLVGAGGEVDDATAKRYGLKLKGAAPEPYDAVADHEAKHGGETEAEADEARRRMLAGEKATAPTENKAVTKAPANKAKE